MERFVEALLYHSRWLLVPLYLGLAVLLLLLSATFLREMWHLASHFETLTETDVILAILALIDLTLVGSLVVMMVISGYENFVSHFDLADGTDKLKWLGKLDAGSLKLKVSSSIVAISSIHLLKSFMNVDKVPNDKLLWLVVLHMTFVVSTLIMAYVEKMSPAKSDM